MILRETPLLSFDDVLLIPKKGILRKREAADISSELVEGVTLQIPVISAPMQAVTESEMAYAMSRSGGFGIIHRFLSIDEQLAQYKKATDHHQPEFALKADAGVAIGVNEGYERWQRLYEAGCRIFCLDVAHGHHQTVYDFIDNAKDVGDSNLIVGNIATAEAARFLAQLPIAAVKVGIGPGAVCTTREVTGFGVPQFSAIRDVAWLIRDSFSNIKVIADGGIKNSGDIVKALAVGADTVMVGRLLAGANEAPHPGLYWGMASKRVNGHNAPEGIEGVVERTGPVSDTLKTLAWGVRSGISYGGAVDIKGLRDNAEFVLVSPGTYIESGVRIGQS